MKNLKPIWILGTISLIAIVTTFVFLLTHKSKNLPQPDLPPGTILLAPKKETPPTIISTILNFLSQPVAVKPIVASPKPTAVPQTPRPTPLMTPIPAYIPTPTPTPRSVTPPPQPTTTPSPVPTSTPASTAPPDISSGLPSGSENTTSFSPRVLFIGYNPTENGVSLTDRYFTATTGYSSAEAMETAVGDNTISAFARLSGGNIQFHIVKTLHVTSFPTFSDGFKYTLDSYKKCVYFDPSYDPTFCEQHKWQFNYPQWVKDNQICQIAKDVNADEIWMMSPPYIMAWENWMIGPNTGFDVNGAAYVVPECDKHYIVVSGSYDRPTNVLHDIGHRVEATMRYLTANWQDDEREKYWEQFAATKYYFNQVPSTPYCGNAHVPANATSHYQYDSHTSGTSICSDWKNFPDLQQTHETVTCDNWGCSDAGWQEYWLGSIPKSVGKVILKTKQGKDFYFLKNWWQYLLFPDKAIMAKQIM